MQFTRLGRCNKCGNEFPSSEEKCDRCGSATLVTHKVIDRRQLILGCSFTIGLLSNVYFNSYFFFPFTLVSGAIISYIDPRLFWRVPLVLYLGFAAGSVIIGVLWSMHDPRLWKEIYMLPMGLFFAFLHTVPCWVGAIVGASARLFTDGIYAGKGFLHTVLPGAVVVVFAVIVLVISFLKVMEWTQAELTLNHLQNNI